MVADIHTCSYQCDNPPCIKRQRDELLARIDALTADAERYRWLRDGGTETLCVRVQGDNPVHPHLWGYYRKCSAQLDAAIDAARQQEAARES